LHAGGNVERDAVSIGGDFDGGGPVGAAGHADQQDHAARRAVFDVQLLKRRARRPVVVGRAFERFAGDEPFAARGVEDFDAMGVTVALAEEHDAKAGGF
jgi:hypothetical protein